MRWGAKEGGEPRTAEGLAVVLHSMLQAFHLDCEGAREGKRRRGKRVHMSQFLRGARNTQHNAETRLWAVSLTAQSIQTCNIRVMGVDAGLGDVGHLRHARGGRKGLDQNRRHAPPARRRLHPHTHSAGKEGEERGDARVGRT